MINNFLKKISKYDGDKYLKIALANTPGYNTLTKAAAPAQQGADGVRQRAQNAFEELDRSTQQPQVQNAYAVNNEALTSANQQEGQVATANLPDWAAKNFGYPYVQIDSAKGQVIAVGKAGGKKEDIEKVKARALDNAKKLASKKAQNQALSFYQPTFHEQEGPSYGQVKIINVYCMVIAPMGSKSANQPTAAQQAQVARPVAPAQQAQVARPVAPAQQGANGLRPNAFDNLDF